MKYKSTCLSGLKGRSAKPLFVGSIPTVDSVTVVQRENTWLWFKMSWVRVPSVTQNTEGVRMDEDTALKAAGCKRLGGSIPSSSAKNGSLAQWIRALLYERRGWGFKSLRNHKLQY
jgi:hypothetical protein